MIDYDTLVPEEPRDRTARRSYASAAGSWETERADACAEAGFGRYDKHGVPKLGEDYVHALACRNLKGRHAPGCPMGKRS